MSLSVKDRKVLWARSGNQCAFPGCEQALVTSVPDIQTDVVLGEEAHIVATSPSGPRGDETPPTSGLHSYENVILLCPTHHTFVDSVPEMFTQDTLIGIKRMHENQIRSSILSHHDPIETFLQSDERFGDIVGSWRIGSSIVVVCSYGSLPIRLNNGHWRGSGISFHQRNVSSTSDAQWLFDSSEAQPDIEYWVSESTLNVVQEVLLFDQGRFVPFVRHEFDLAQIPGKERRFLLLEPDSTAVSRIPSLVHDIESFNRSDPMDDIYIRLFRLWQAGLTDPARVREILKGFRGSWWYDGAVAETVSSMVEELALVETSSRAAE